MYFCASYVCNAYRSQKRGVEYPETRITNDCELPCWLRIEPGSSGVLANEKLRTNPGRNKSFLHRWAFLRHFEADG